MVDLVLPTLSHVSHEHHRPGFILLLATTKSGGSEMTANKIAGANRCPVSQFESRGLQPRAPGVENQGRYHGGPAVAEMLQVNGVGAQVSSSEADNLTAFLEDYLSSFPKDGRLLKDGSVTREPKGSPDFSDGDWDRHYSATYDWLVSFRDFCRRSRGFEIV
jgi:hypothetical protein